ncbi:MAG: ATP-binding protein [Candidatus Diapherotrites archaeon]|nr:ATP-binding protein [Candidatus Diapherotrites archaeon]
MLLKETLRGIVRSQRDSLSGADYGIVREKNRELDLKLPFAMILSGIRRCGKSTLLRQLIKKTNGFYYFNFEDPRAAGFEVSDFQKLNDVFLEEFGRSDYYFFDEIQNVQKWELFVRTMLDNKKHFVITGSNASLLSRELGTRLTGRHLRYELFPFSFAEFLTLKGRKPSHAAFEDYLCKGGFPEYLKSEKAEILQELLNDVIARDVVVRYGLRNLKTVKRIAVFLLTNIGKEFSYNGIKKLFSLGSTNSAIAFISYLEDCYLLFALPKFDYSLKKQLVSLKKIYAIDNGLASVNSASFSSDNGRMLENAVFLGLRRKNQQIFYFREKNECDFLVKEREKITRAIQVCWGLDEDNKEREINGLLEALEKFNLREGLILTNNQEDRLEIKNRHIIVKPVWKWLLS